MKLVITEKPSVARSIAAVIGAVEKQNGYFFNLYVWSEKSIMSRLTLRG